METRKKHLPENGFRYPTKNQKKLFAHKLSRLDSYVSLNQLPSKQRYAGLIHTGNGQRNVKNSNVKVGLKTISEGDVVGEGNP